MNRLFHLLLVLSALLGLIAQETAYAAGPHISMMSAAPETTSASAMDVDCMEMMQQQQQQQQPEQKPCKGLTLDCIAAMGCVVPLALTSVVLPMGDSTYVKMVHFAPLISPLSGRSFGPEPEPPTA